MFLKISMIQVVLSMRCLTLRVRTIMVWVTRSIIFSVHYDLKCDRSFDVKNSKWIDIINGFSTQEQLRQDPPGETCLEMSLADIKTKYNMATINF